MKVLTANDLETGEVVFWNRGRWAIGFNDGERVDGHWLPIAYRERLRALGPSNHPQHGKQADGDADVDALRAVTASARSAGRVKLIKR